MASAGFNQLERKVTQEYRGRGYSEKRAEHVGQAVAGLTAHRKWSKAGKVPAEVKRQRECVASGLAGKHYGSRAAQQKAFAARVQECARRERSRGRRRD